jgi:hypothetical protein
MLITKTSLPRRTFLRGLGTTLALPLLDAMVPALTALKNTAAKPVPRFGAIYVGNGANMSQWTPATEGVELELSPILKPLETLQNRIVVLTGLDNWPALDQGDTGGQHSRSGVAFMSAVHAKQTEGADVRAGITVDQIVARELCGDCRLPSLELALDRIDIVGGCEHRYACAYVNSISWRTPTMPLPMETNPRFAFDRLFGTGDTAQARLARQQEDRSILDVVTKQISRLHKTLGPRDSVKLGEYLDAIRDVERRIQAAEAQSVALAVPDRPLGIPGTVKEHAELMFDLQVLAFQADLTRVSTLMLAREISSQTYGEIGLPDGHHTISHHGNNPEKQANYAKLNTYHVRMFADFLSKLQSTNDGNGTLLDHSLLLYGSGMSEGNTHNNLNVPVVVAAGAGTDVKGGRHLRYPKGTPLANLSLSLLEKLGVATETFGDSTGRLDLLSGV